MFWSSINKCVDMKGETKTETETETKLVWQIGSPHFSNIKKEIYIYIYISWPSIMITTMIAMPVEITI